MADRKVDRFSGGAGIIEGLRRRRLALEAGDPGAAAVSFREGVAGKKKKKKKKNVQLKKRDELDEALGL